MPIRPVKPYSDRGSLKDLVEIQTEDLDPPTPFELRLKEIYEHSLATRDNTLLDATGLIVMSGSNDRSGYPVTVYRHREYINSLSESHKEEIEKTKEELSGCISQGILYPEMSLSQAKQQDARKAILEEGSLLIKVAGQDVSVTPKRAFRRVIK